MIPLPWMVWVKLGAAAIVISLLIAVGLVVRGWHNDSLALASAQADLKEISEQAAQAMATLAAQQRASYEASEGYQRELETLRNRPVSTRIVRVLVPARPTLPAPGATPGGPDGASQAGGVVHDGAGQTTSRDIGPDLNALMMEADRCSAQLRGLQTWVALTSPP